MGNQHCNGQCNHHGTAASFVLNQRLANKLVDRQIKDLPLVAIIIHIQIIKIQIVSYLVLLSPLWISWMVR